MDVNQIVNITYTNYNHQTRTYRIVPTKIEFTKSQWHPEEQWILIAFDLDRNCERWFAMKDIQTWGKGESDLFDGVTGRSSDVAKLNLGDCFGVINKVPDSI